MTKTPEQMAMEYIKDVETARNPSVAATAFPQMQRCFLAGYKAAQEQYREAVKVLDKHKAAAEKAVTNIKNASDWVTIEKAKANENT